MSSPPFRLHLFHYTYQGSEWVFEIPETSPEDAKMRLARMLDGVCEEIIPDDNAPDSLPAP